MYSNCGSLVKVQAFLQVFPEISKTGIGLKASECFVAIILLTFPCQKEEVHFNGFCFILFHMKQRVFLLQKCGNKLNRPTSQKENLRASVTNRLILVKQKNTIFIVKWQKSLIADCLAPATP